MNQRRLLVLSSIFPFSLFATTTLIIGEMAKANQMTWRHADGFHSHIVRSSNKRRLRQHLLSLPLSLVLVAPLKTNKRRRRRLSLLFLCLSRWTKLSSVEYIQRSGRSSVKQCPVSLQRTSTRKVTVARAQGLVVREMFHRNDVGEQGQRNATHPDRPFSGNPDKGT